MGSRFLIAVDLDGTYLTINSMEAYTLYVFQALLTRLRWCRAARVLAWVVKRKLRRCDHRTMKHAILKAAAPVSSPEAMERFARHLLRYVNPDVQKLIDQRKAKGWKTILATAAPDIYALPLAKIQGFDYACATELTDNPDEFGECKGQAKLRAVKKIMREQNLKLGTVVTDHDDDLPLLNACQGECFIIKRQ